MNRKILKKIKLINWHYFENEEIEVQDSALFFGDNGSGKSTVLDALQYVLTAGGKSFNKAANENSRRDLKGYVRCKTGGEGKTYKRNGKVTSFVALEFYEESKRQNFVVGVKLDSPSEEGQIRRGWFIENCRFEDIAFIKDNKPVSDSADFTARGKKITCIKTDEEAKARILQRLGNLDYTLCSRKEAVQKAREKINTEIANLKKNRLNYSDSVLKVRAAIEKTFREEGIDSSVTLLCEALEITDETWRDAIEGYLNTQKFALLVSPQYFKTAVRIYRGLGREVSGVFVVDTTKFMSDAEEDFMILRLKKGKRSFVFLLSARKAAAEKRRYRIMSS